MLHHNDHITRFLNIVDTKNQTTFGILYFGLFGGKYSADQNNFYLNHVNYLEQILILFIHLQKRNHNHKAFIYNFFH